MMRQSPGLPPPLPRAATERCRARGGGRAWDVSHSRAVPPRVSVAPGARAYPERWTPAARVAPRQCGEPARGAGRRRPRPRASRPRAAAEAPVATRTGRTRPQSEWFRGATRPRPRAAGPRSAQPRRASSPPDSTSCVVGGRSSFAAESPSDRLAPRCAGASAARQAPSTGRGRARRRQVRRRRRRPKRAGEGGLGRLDRAPPESRSGWRALERRPATRPATRPSRTRPPPAAASPTRARAALESLAGAPDRPRDRAPSALSRLAASHPRPSPDARSPLLRMPSRPGSSPTPPARTPTPTPPWTPTPTPPRTPTPTPARRDGAPAKPALAAAPSRAAAQPLVLVLVRAGWTTAQRSPPTPAEASARRGRQRPARRRRQRSARRTDRPARCRREDRRPPSRAVAPLGESDPIPFGP
jgi:hypothetical protein